MMAAKFTRKNMTRNKTPVQKSTVLNRENIEKIGYKEKKQDNIKMLTIATAVAKMSDVDFWQTDE